MKHYTRTLTLFLFISVLVGQPTFTEYSISTSADGAKLVYAADVDGDGIHEVYYADYGGAWSINAGDIYVVDYDAGEDVTTIGPDQVHRIGNAGSFSGDIGNGYDGHDNPYIFSSRSRPNLSALEYIGPDPSLGTSYLEKVIYWGELDVTETKTTTDETGAVDVVHTYRWGFPSKVQTHWGDDLLDLPAMQRHLQTLWYRLIVKYL